MSNVIDELIIKLTLDAEKYRQAEKRIAELDARTFRQQQERARRTDRMNRDQQSRLANVSAGVRTFARQVAGATAIVSGLGLGIAGTLTGFLNFETNLRRQAVSTGLSNRQMQAWGATARRLGADANAGAEAVAALARETQQGLLTGEAPIMQALARMGVNIGPGASVEDMLSQAQGRMREASPEQRALMEAALAAQGVSGDLILMLKSEIDVREAFARSFAQSVDENRKNLDQLADATASLKAAAISAAGTLSTALVPVIQTAATKLGDWSTELATFANNVNAAGGGAKGLQIELDRSYPKLGHLMEGFTLLSGLLPAVQNGFANLAERLPDVGKSVRELFTGIRNPFGTNSVAEAVDANSQRTYEWLFGRDDENGAMNRAALAIDDWWRRATSQPGAAGNTHATNPALPRNLENNAGGAVPANAQSIMGTLISQYGLNTAEAAAVVANLQRESGLRADALNTAGGGTGARGLAQWRGARSRAFQQRYGVMPDRGSVAQQLEFMMTDPYERGLLQRSLRAGGATAAGMGESVSRIFEAHGNQAEDRARGALAAQYAGAAAPPINIQNLTVQSNDAPGLVQGLQRLDTTQPYSTVVR